MRNPGRDRSRIALRSIRVTDCAEKGVENLFEAGTVQRCVIRVLRMLPYPGLDRRQLGVQRVFGDFGVVARLAAEPIAVGETEETTQAQVGIGSDTALTRKSSSRPA